MLPHLFLIFIVLNFLDWWTTNSLLALGFAEANPIMDILFSYGPWYALIFKVIIISLIFLSLQHIQKHSWRAAFYTLVFLNIIYLGIVINNIWWLYS